jgi:glucose/arabinose dehydrogenase
MRHLPSAFAGVVALAAAALWPWAGAVAGTAAQPSGQRETLLHERIKVPQGYVFQVFARDVGRPRLMVMAPSGDLIVSDSRGSRVLLVKADRDGDGSSDGTVVLAEGLDVPHGLVLGGSSLLVAEQTEVVKYVFDGNSLAEGTVILDGIPSGGHVTRTLKRGPDGFLYLSIGSSCNSCIEANPWRAAILRFREGETPEIFASGLRNTVGFDWQPGTGKLYGVDNGRDNLGDDVPDDEVNLIEAGRHYGWPYVHGFGVRDPSLYGRRPAGFVPVAPVFGVGAHVAPLSIHFLKARPGVALIAEHGSWNRSKKVGYRLVTLDFNTSPPRSAVFLAGCEEMEKVICRPVDTLEAPDGSLYVSDDFGGAIYRIGKAP